MYSLTFSILFSGIDDEKDIMNSFYLILMKDVSDNYFQDTGMNKIQAENLMQALAKFHATHWRKGPNDTGYLFSRIIVILKFFEMNFNLLTGTAKTVIENWVSKQSWLF